MNEFDLRRTKCNAVKTPVITEVLTNLYKIKLSKNIFFLFISADIFSNIHILLINIF